MPDAVEVGVTLTVPCVFGEPVVDTGVELFLRGFGVAPVVATEELSDQSGEGVFVVEGWVAGLGEDHRQPLAPECGVSV